MNVPVWVGKTEIDGILWTNSLDLIIEAIDSSVRQASVARMCRCVALARIERDELYRQAVDPETGKRYESATEYFANPDIAARFRIPDDRRRRSILMIQGRALLDAHTSGAIDLRAFDPTGHWEKLKSWSKAIERYGDPQLVMDKLLELPKNDFKAFATGESVSSRLETPLQHPFQRYFLGYEGSYRVADG
jgi:hypothetical protein